VVEAALGLGRVEALEEHVADQLDAALGDVGAARGPGGLGGPGLALLGLTRGVDHLGEPGAKVGVELHLCLLAGLSWVPQGYQARWGRGRTLIKKSQESAGGSSACGRDPLRVRRSEERRVGEESTARGRGDHAAQKQVGTATRSR